MTIETPRAATTNLVERGKNILLQPRAEWDRIAPEPAELAKLYGGYLLPLALISAVAATVGMMFFRVGGWGYPVRVGPTTAIASGVLHFVIVFIFIYVMALIVNALAPNFGSQANPHQAQKLSIYSATAYLLASVFALIPALSPLIYVGVAYSLVLVYLGLPRLMKTSEDKRVSYFLAVIGAAIALFLIAALVMATVRNSLVGYDGMRFETPAQEEDVAIELENGDSVSVNQLDTMDQAYSDALPGAPGVAVDPAQLQALLPADLPGGFIRSSASSNATGADGMGAGQAEGSYESGESVITITIVHMGAMPTAMAGSVNIQENREDAEGYSRTNTVDGRVYTEEVNRVAGSANYGIIGRGVAVTAEGQGVTIEQVRTAVEAVGIARAEGVGAPG